MAPVVAVFRHKFKLYLIQVNFKLYLNHYNLGLFWKIVYNLAIKNILIFSGIQPSKK